MKPADVRSFHSPQDCHLSLWFPPLPLTQGPQAQGTNTHHWLTGRLMSLEASVSESK